MTRNLALVPPLLKTKEIAELLGVTRRTVRDWARSGLLPSIKIGRDLLFREGDVLQLLKPRERPQPSLPLFDAGPEPSEAA